MSAPFSPLAILDLSTTRRCEISPTDAPSVGLVNIGSQVAVVHPMAEVPCHACALCLPPLPHMLECHRSHTHVLSVIVVLSANAASPPSCQPLLRKTSCISPGMLKHDFTTFPSQRHSICGKCRADHEPHVFRLPAPLCCARPLRPLHAARQFVGQPRLSRQPVSAASPPVRTTWRWHTGTTCRWQGPHGQDVPEGQHCPHAAHPHAQPRGRSGVPPRYRPRTQFFHACAL